VVGLKDEADFSVSIFVLFGWHGLVGRGVLSARYAGAAAIHGRSCRCRLIRTGRSTSRFWAMLSVSLSAMGSAAASCYWTFWLQCATV